jgi:hypothetical protein
VRDDRGSQQNPPPMATTLLCQIKIKRRPLRRLPWPGWLSLATSPAPTPPQKPFNDLRQSICGRIVTLSCPFRAVSPGGQPRIMPGSATAALAVKTERCPPTGYPPLRMGQAPF